MHTLLRITAFAGKYKLQMAAAWLSLLLSTLAFIATPRLVGTAIDDVLGAADTSRLWILGGAVLAAMVLRGLFQYITTYLAEAISQRVSYDVRNKFYDKLQRMSFAFHDREHTGNLMSKATVDVEMTRFFVSMGLIRSGQILLLTIGAAVMMFTIDWFLGLVALTFVPFIAFRAIIVNFTLRRIWRRVQEEMGRMTTILQENLSGMRVVKAFGADEHEKAKFREQIGHVFDYSYQAARLRASNNALMQAIFWSSTLLIVWLGGRAVMDDRISLGQLAEFILYTSLLVQPIRIVGMMVNIFARAVSAGERLFEVLDARSPVEDRPGAQPLTDVRGAVSFEHVGFGYAGREALQDIDIRIEPGQVVALLGPPGAGKSTLINLLGRFYDVDEGRVTIDGVDIRDVTIDSLRRTVGIVQQDVFIFSASVRENIAYGREDATLDEVIDAAKTARLHDEIMELPEGYDTVVGERGMTFSGGQRQRLAIARTLVLDPPILVLDDSTSSVDAGTESQIQEAMASVIRGRTTFIIAHRLSSIQHASLVVVLNEGRIMEIGAPTELLSLDGFYHHIAQLQYAGNGHDGHGLGPGVSPQPAGGN